jgi:hypothetical protein
MGVERTAPKSPSRCRDFRNEGEVTSQPVDRILAEHSLRAGATVPAAGQRKMPAVKGPIEVFADS